MEKEETRIVSAAADIISSQIKAIKEYEIGSKYPSTEELTEDNILKCLPKSIITLLSRIIRSKGSKKKYLLLAIVLFKLLVLEH